MNIFWTRWNYFPNKFQQWPFSRGMKIWRICDLQILEDIWRHLTTDVSFFRPYEETKNNGSEQKICITLPQFRSWFRSCGAKVSSFMFQKFSRSFSLSFKVSVDAVCMFLSCSMIPNFLWLLKSWSCMLKWLKCFYLFIYTCTYYIYIYIYIYIHIYILVYSLVPAMCNRTSCA